MHTQNLLIGLGLVAQLATAQQPTQTSRSGSHALLRRANPPTGSCPEQFGNAPMHCSDSACGGQSGTAGVCKNNSGNGKPCQCNAATAAPGAPAPIATKVTTTNSAGATIVGTYNLITIDKYKSLKQSETVTMTRTTTGTDGKQTPAVIVGGVAAGGVLWILGTTGNAAEAAALAAKPPAPPEGHKDDTSCPNPKKKCKDCGAVAGINMCVTSSPGCGCEPEEEKKCPSTPVKCDNSACAGKNGKCTKGDPKDCPCTESCPAGDQQPKCNDDGCKGNNGKCTTGDHKDCGCKSCPTGDQQPRCDNDQNCKGKDGKCTLGDNKSCACKSCPTGDKQPKCDDEKNCKGKDGKCTLGDDKGCACKENSCPEKRYTPYCSFCGDKGSDGKCKGIANKENLFKGCECWDEPQNPFPYQKVKPEVEQSALTLDVDKLPNISPSSYSYGGDDPLKCQNTVWSAPKNDLKKAISDWCKSVNGKKVTKSGNTDVIYKRFDQKDHSYWLGAQYDGKSGGNCGDSADVKEINCVSTMMEELDDCDAGKPDFKGAELTDGCVRYHVTFSRSQNDNDPPFKPLPQKDAECKKDNADSTGIPQEFWEGVSKKFCKDVGDGKTAKKEDLKNTDVVTRSLFRRTPPPSPNSYPDTKFHFEWAPTGKGICSKSCSEAMSAMGLTCSPFGVQIHQMLKAGSIDVGCGKYSYSITEPPKKDTSAPPDGTNKQCVAGKSNPMGFDRDEAMNTIIPQFCGGKDVKDQTFKKDSKYPKLDYRSQVYPDMMVNLAITGNGKCDDKTSMYVSQDRCQHMLGAILVDACSTDTRSDKMGGTLDDQCVTYSIKGSEAKADWAKGKCSVGITQYYDGKDYKIDGVLKDAKGGLLAQCKNEKASLNSAVLCQTGNHSVLPKMMQITQRDDGTMSLLYLDQRWSTTDNQCKGGKDKFKDGKRTITCDWTC